MQPCTIRLKPRARTRKHSTFPLVRDNAKFCALVEQVLCNTGVCLNRCTVNTCDPRHKPRCRPIEPRLLGLSLIFPYVRMQSVLHSFILFKLWPDTILGAYWGTHYLARISLTQLFISQFCYYKTLGSAVNAQVDLWKHGWRQAAPAHKLKRLDHDQMRGNHVWHVVDHDNGSGHVHHRYKRWQIRLCIWKVARRQKAFLKSPLMLPSTSWIFVIFANCVRSYPPHDHVFWRTRGRA